ncbi:Uncharacterised protein [Vibrio cholerae]|nr:Uncharacterised protein [Vibrio cholerae]CSD16296.1 Uncharacterised protein [Vibrio cholerae]CSI66374.1 Uncharacterised protein [Vibrio cholerae]
MSEKWQTEPKSWRKLYKRWRKLNINKKSSSLMSAMNCALLPLRF